MTLPILLVARSRCPEPDSNLHRTTYPSPPLRSAQAAQEGQFILRGGGPSDYKIVVSCCTTITADGASNLTWRQGASRARRPAASSSRTCDGAACPIRCWSSPTARPACSARSRMICLSDESPPTRFVVIGLNLLLLLEYWLGWLSLRQPQPDLRQWDRVARASRSLNVPAISRHCCARRRYSSALLATAYCPSVG